MKMVMRGRQKAVRRGEPKPVVSIWMGFLISRVYWEAEDAGVKQQLLGHVAGPYSRVAKHLALHKTWAVFCSIARAFLIRKRVWGEGDELYPRVPWALCIQWVHS